MSAHTHCNVFGGYARTSSTHDGDDFSDEDSDDDGADGTSGVTTTYGVYVREAGAQGGVPGMLCGIADAQTGFRLTYRRSNASVPTLKLEGCLGLEVAELSPDCSPEPLVKFAFRHLLL